MNHDNINNVFASIKNAQTIGALYVYVPHTKNIAQILDVLTNEGYIRYYQKSEKYRLKIALKYDQQTRIPTIRELKGISKPSKRIYYKSIELKQIPWYYTYILATPKGILSNRKALQLNVGGEVLCKIR